MLFNEEQVRNHRVAVYGSLLQGLGNHRLLDNSESELLGRFRSYPEYTLHSLHGGYPGLKLNGEDSVVFEVYQVSTRVLHNLNALEGYNPDSTNNNFYDRHVISTPYGKAYTYVYQPETDTRLVHGDWFLFKTGVKSELNYGPIEQEGVRQTADATS